jgi:hypothetical protein
MALLGELHYIPSGPGAWVNLPRESGVAYAAQESWIQNETIRVSIGPCNCFFFLFRQLINVHRKIFFLACRITKSDMKRVRLRLYPKEHVDKHDCVSHLSMRSQARSRALQRW